jgi:hypothetical protein
MVRAVERVPSAPSRWILMLGSFLIGNIPPHALAEAHIILFSSRRTGKVIIRRYLSLHLQFFKWPAHCLHQRHAACQASTNNLAEHSHSVKFCSEFGSRQDDLVENKFDQ